MKKNIGVLFLFVLLFSTYGCVNVFKMSDLRQEGYSYPNDTAKAKQLLAEMGEAHNIKMWDSLETYNVIYTDEFYGFLGKQSHPFKEQDMSFSLDYIPNTFNGQLEIISGEEKGKTWGMQDWKVYEEDANGKVNVKENKDMTFWIPTYQYFVEFPSRIQEASVVDYIGTKTINGVETEGLIASWNTVEPQKKLDQYLIWLDAKTKRIVKVEYTVREMYKFVAGAAYYQDYKDYNGFILPSKMPVESNLLSEGFLHTMGISDFTPNKVSAADLTPLK